MFTEAVQTAQALRAGGVQRPLVPSAPHLSHREALKVLAIFLPSTRHGAAWAA